MRQEHRTWFPFIMIGITVLILVAYGVWGRSSNLPQESAGVRQEVEAVDAGEYQAEVIRILEDFDAHQDAGQTYEDLLIVKVPAEYRDLHLELVVAFGELRANKIESGEARLDLLRRQTDWLP